jgi:hypothetical protein
VKPWRKIASLVVLVVLLLVGGKLFQSWSAGPVPVEIHYLLGDPPVAAGLEVTAGPYAHFETTLVGPDVVDKTHLPAGPHRLEITMLAPNGRRYTVYRTIEAARNAVIRIDLSRERGGA